MFFRLEQRLGPALGCRSAVPSGQTLHGTNPSGDGTLVSEATRCLFFFGSTCWKPQTYISPYLMIFMDSAKNSRRGFCLEKEVWLYLSSSRSRVFTPRSNCAFRNRKITLIVFASFGYRNRQPESSSDDSMTFPDNIAECQEWAEDKAVMKLAEKLKEEATDATACCFTPSARKAAGRTSF